VCTGSVHLTYFEQVTCYFVCVLACFHDSIQFYNAVFFSSLLLVTPVTILHTCEQSQMPDPPSPAPSSLLFTSYLSGAPHYWNEAKSYAHGNVGKAVGLRMMERRTCCCPYQLQPNYRSDVIILTKHFTRLSRTSVCLRNAINKKKRSALFTPAVLKLKHHINKVKM
jgi:hypothetical protein